jgi:hypothetical protein
LLNKRWLVSFIAALSLVLLCLALAWVSNGFIKITGWATFLPVSLISAVLLAGGWWLIKAEKPPHWLAVLLVGSAVLRLAAGVVWFAVIPIGGHGTPTERSGYIMADAGARDKAAWKLAASERPLFSAFEKNLTVDQYGGMLFSTAFIYRYLGGEKHFPLLIVLLCASFSALAVLFTWAFSRRLWGEKVANLSAWVIALYPEAVLLGSSQMREAFTITLTIAAFYGLIRYQQEHTLKNLGWMVFPLLVCLPLSTPITALVLGALSLPGVVSLYTASRQAQRKRSLWLVIGGLTVLILLGLYLALRQFTPPEMSNPLEMLKWWLSKSARLQGFLSQHSSGWMQKIFKTSPTWLHLPLLTGYGILQPFLPATLVVGSQAPAWPWINAWRSIGWTIMLAFLLYAPILAFRRQNPNLNGAGGYSEKTYFLTRSLCLAVWIVILIASFRAGADMWDNPRYRATFAGLQAALAAWAWVEHRRLKDPWMRRALLAFGAFLAWFLPWYLQRYTSFKWPVTEFFSTLGLGVASAFLLVLWDWARTSKITNPPNNHIPSTKEPPA